MKKQLIALMLLVMMVLPLTACEGALVSSSSTLMAVSHSTNDSFSMKYQKFDGQKQQRIVARDYELEVRMDIVTESGTLSVSVAESGNPENVVYSADNLQTGSYTFQLPKADRYTVTLTAEDHVGSYSFDWDN